MNPTRATSHDDEATRLPPEAERALRERLEFEALITDISAGVVVATPETIDQALRDALEWLRTAVGAERAVFFEYAPTERDRAATVGHWISR
jgi:hypothetical protein